MKIISKTTEASKTVYAIAAFEQIIPLRYGTLWFLRIKLKQYLPLQHFS